MKNLVNDYLDLIRNAQRSHRAAGDTAGAVAAYDRLFGEMLTKFTSANETERSFVRSAMTREGSGLLLGAAEGAATWSIREKDASRLRGGLAALLIENLKEDFRETLIGLALLHNSARKLKVDFEELYRDVRHFGTIEACELFEQYFAEGGKTLHEMGYQESVNDAGEFCYSSGW
jgi:hypothetical protein